MKILFAVKSLSNFSYVSSIVKALCENGSSVTVLFGFEQSRESSVEFGRTFLATNENVSLEWQTTPKQDIEAYKPDVVIASPANHRDSTEQKYIAAAKRLGIPTVVTALSWDNLTTKKKIRPKPDRLFVWNETHKADAAKIHKIKEDSIIVTGAPFFDKWFDSIEPVESRYVFCKRIGMDCWEPTVLYMGSSANIANNESWLITELRSFTNVLVRPHPANYRKYLWQEHYDVYPRQGRLIESRQDISDFYLSLEYAKCVFGINTSAMIDAIVLNKPCVTLIADEYSKTQSGKEHFKRLLPAMYVCKTIEELENCIRSLSDGMDVMASSRKRFVKKYIRPHKISAGEYAAKAILEG